MVLGIVLSAIAGMAISLQTVFNNKVNEKTGSWMTTTIALGMGFVFALVASLLAGGLRLDHMETWYWFGGVIGVGVVFCLVQAIKILGPTFTISIVLTAQLGSALLWDTLGWFGLEQMPFKMNKLIGILIIIAGIFMFKYKSPEDKTKATSPNLKQE